MATQSLKNQLPNSSIKVPSKIKENKNRKNKKYQNRKTILSNKNKVKLICHFREINQ